MKTLTELRRDIDAIDDELIDLLARRQRCVEEVVKVKRREKLAARDPQRIAEVIAHVKARAKRRNADPALAETVWTGMIEWFVAFEERSL